MPGLSGGAAPASSAATVRATTEVLTETGAWPRRVVLAVTGLEVGGTERQVCLLAAGLAARGIDVSVVVTFDPAPLAPALEAAGVTVHHAGFVRLRAGRARALAADAGALARYARWLRRARPDVVHAFLAHAAGVTIPVARALRVPVVVEGRRNLGTARGGIGSRLEALPTRLAHHVVANADAVAADVVARGIPAGRVSTIPNAVDPGMALPGGSPNAPVELAGATPPVVVTVANPRPVKGLDELVDAARLLAAGGLRPTFVVVGDGPDRSRVEARAAEAAQAIAADVRFVGQHPDVRPWLAAADVYVQPSRAEGSSNAVLEAMAAGRAIVATAVGGTPALLGDAGVLVPPRDPAALAAAIADLARDPQQRLVLGERAAARAASAFGVEALVDAHLERYRSLRPCAG